MTPSKIISLQTDINVNKLSKKILKNEPRILKKYPAKSADGISDFDGETGLGFNSLTSRSPHFNVLDWWGTGNLRKWIRKGYEKYNDITDSPLYVQCWANVMRKGQQIKPHSHRDGQRDPVTNFLSGNLSVCVDGSTSTYYDGSPILNKNGWMVFFPGHVYHWTNRYEGPGERITVAFDIYNKEFFEYDRVMGDRNHWVRI